MKNNSMMKRCVSALLIFALVLTAVIAMPTDTQAATKYAKSVSKTLEDKTSWGESLYVIPINMKKDAKVTVTVEYVSKDGGDFSRGMINVFENISDFIDQVDEEDRKGKNVMSDYVNKEDKKTSVTIKAKKGSKSGIVVGLQGWSKVKVTVKCGNSYVKLGKVKDLSE